MKNELFNEQINNLEEDLQELLEKAEKILGFKTEGINTTVKELLKLDDQNASILASDILDIEDDIIKTEEYYIEEEIDDPFNSLYDEDQEL